MQSTWQEPFLYQSVERQIMEMIEGGTLEKGDRLPSLRAMRVRTGLSLSTVNQAYMELESKGVIESRPRSGFFVRRSFRRLEAPLPRPANPTPRAVNRSQLIQTVLEAVGNPSLAPLGVICPTEELLPTKALTRILNRVMREHPTRAMSYETIPGNEELRRQISFRCTDPEAAIKPDDLIITAGAMEGLSICLRALTRPGDNVLIQTPTYYCFLQLLENLGLRAVEVPSGPETGVDPADVASALEKYEVKACIMCPNFNNPDGSLTPTRAKREILRLLEQRDVPLVEDDVYTDLHFTGPRPCSYKALDNKGMVMLCCSFSKSVCPGWRVGWLAPGRFHDRALEVKATTNVCTASPNQMAMAEFLAAGLYERQLKRLRSAVEKQMRLMRGLLGQCFPAGTRVTEPRGGAVLWVDLPGQADAVELFYRAKEHGIGVVPGPIFTMQEGFDNCLRLSCGGVWSESLEQALRTLGSLASELAGTDA
ncbi:DNA-binding transcriptional regulator, MocR family, contains an aminotransferase domain [Paucidesulfovibrio gracilis DSM 16080]|uniref:DNA-binding transcriptional regulator, MocR family, contains an aminotransferase domain n=1 Tax=Paucidesulfovibrio gracilis DSM 16080 TaxID=1121449 RepID=A0A1T4XSP3_9BACT|nr:PLP-dependent aminotransferase family protein [Paucidesulfovibrio gracilis]SKA92572.1 DNA-binding transcriptional regulator, MocR family, contains an aminotransferase domain [Paucidesulfovibrio gracilis DSM 16080]